MHPARNFLILSLLLLFFVCAYPISLSYFTSDLTNRMYNFNQSIMNEYVSNMKFILWM